MREPSFRTLLYARTLLRSWPQPAHIPDSARKPAPAGNPDQAGNPAAGTQTRHPGTPAPRHGTPARHPGTGHPAQHPAPGTPPAGRPGTWHLAPGIRHPGTAPWHPALGLIPGIAARLGRERRIGQRHESAHPCRDHDSDPRIHVAAVVVAAVVVAGVVVVAVGCGVRLRTALFRSIKSSKKESLGRRPYRVFMRAISGYAALLYSA